MTGYFSILRDCYDRIPFAPSGIPTGRYVEIAK